jgi:tetratricopeptide (TPR) repeat protein
MSGSTYNNKYNDPTLPGYDPGKKISKNDDDTNTMSAVELANRGAALLRSGKYEEALEWYHKSLSINPNNAIAWTDAGHASYSLSRYSEAAQYFSNAIKYYPNAIALNPNNAHTWAYVGVAVYMSYLSLNATHQNSYDDIKRAYIEIALKFLDKSLSINPNDAYALKNKNTLLNELTRGQPPPQGPAYPPEQGPMSKGVETVLANLGMKGIIGNI